MRTPVVDQRTFRLSRINEPKFFHLKLLPGWIVYFLTENHIPAEAGVHFPAGGQGDF